MSEWQPIETAPIRPFDPETWYRSASSSVLVWDKYVQIAFYCYTSNGKGRWASHHGMIKPTHWMPLPDAPK